MISIFLGIAHLAKFISAHLESKAGGGERGGGGGGEEIEFDYVNMRGAF